MGKRTAARKAHAFQARGAGTPQAKKNQARGLVFDEAAVDYSAVGASSASVTSGRSSSST
jgi:hypothetical protein